MNQKQFNEYLEERKFQSSIEDQAPEYFYHVEFWGGFFNEEYKHGIKNGCYWFRTQSARTRYINKLKKVEQEIDARHLAIHLAEGCHLTEKPALHRVLEWKGKQYHLSYEMFYGFEHSTCTYHMTWKWTPGFNCYIPGHEIKEDIDYENEVKEIASWITGSFEHKDEER